MRTRMSSITIARFSAVLLALGLFLGSMNLANLSGWTAAARVDPAAVSLQAYTFTGHVYRGQPYDTSTPIAGVTVGLWGDEDEWPEGGAARAQWRVHVRRCVSMASGFRVCVGALAISLMMESTRAIPRPSAAGVGIAAAAVAAARARYTGLG